MMLRISLVLSLLFVPITANAQALRDRIGITHVGGKYATSDGDYLNAGARLIHEELGSRVIKLWLTRTPARLYAFHSPAWETATYANDLVSIADHEYFRNVFAMPFSTIILVVDSRHDVWSGDGMKPEEIDAEEQSLYHLSRYLMETYAGSGKTFILQNWEADWLLRLDSDSGALIEEGEPGAKAVGGMIDWLNARQRGVARARADLANIGGITVKNAIEVNHVWRAKYAPWRAKYAPWRVSVTDDVLTHVAADMYAYSAWETAGDPSGQMLKEMLTYLDARTPGTGNVYVGEFGAPENEYGTAEHLNRVRAQTHAALEWGAAYVVYWQLYCNEFADEIPPAGVVLNGDMRGFWLVRPDGTRSPAWHFIRGLIAPSRARLVRRQGTLGGSAGALQLNHEN